MVTTARSPSATGSTWLGINVTSGRSRRSACRSRQWVHKRGKGMPRHSTPGASHNGRSTALAKTRIVRSPLNVASASMMLLA